MSDKPIAVGSVAFGPSTSYTGDIPPLPGMREVLNKRTRERDEAKARAARLESALLELVAAVESGIGATGDCPECNSTVQSKGEWVRHEPGCRVKAALDNARKTMEAR